MRPASDPLIAFLASRQPYWSSDLFTFSLPNATTLRLASSDRSILAGANLFVAANAGSIGITRGAWGIKNTLEVPTLEINIISSGTDYAGGSNVKLAMHNGLLDGAWIQLDRAYMPTTGPYGDTALGTVQIFAGRTGEVKITSTGAKITVRGGNVLMNQFMPRNRFLTSCIHTLYDAGCTLVRATSTFAGTVSTASSIAINWVSDPTSGHFANLALGTVTMTSGPANGQKRTIGSAASGAIVVLYPFYEIPLAGDTFTVTYGCDKTRDGANGCAFFSNQQHYRGFKYVPPAETAAVA
jgi:Uncharacterized conserved protein (DUF2163)/Phage conserved hypothetical protein BR0599